jgi:glycosyltransferase involved in cell wall biosynthesis
VTIHILGMPFSETIADWSHCAFTQRTTDFATMLTRAGLDVRLYAGEHNDAEVTEHIALMTSEERKSLWPDYEPKRDIFNSFDPALLGWAEFNARAAAEIAKRAKSGDILAITMGTSHKPVWDALQADESLAGVSMAVVEVGIGYSGVWAPHRVFESRAWQSYLAARAPTDDVRPYDTVIPRAWLAEDFPAGKGDGGYLLFVGRLYARKGPQVAAEVAKRLGLPLWVAGQGMGSVTEGQITCTDGTVLDGDVHYLGVLDPVERAKVMGAATAILVPTQYFEPLGGVSIEAQLTGTPAIVSNWGGLPENVVEGQTGFACDLLRDYTAAVEKAAGLDRGFVREHALATWSTEALAPKWLAYFDRLSTLSGDRGGWYAT